LLLSSYLEDAVSDKEDVVSVSDDEVVIQGEDEVVSQEQELSKVVSAPMLIFAAGRGLDGSLLHSRLSIIRRWSGHKRLLVEKSYSLCADTFGKPVHGEKTRLHPRRTTRREK
jgi:hypothetical protein